MSMRESIREWIGGFLAFGRVRDSITAQSQVLLEVEGIEEETKDQQEVWSAAPLQFRPADPSSDGSCEALLMRQGDELVAVATRDLRWKVGLEKGDVVISSMTEGAITRLYLRADGTAVLEADDVRIGSSSASNKIGLGDVIQNYLTSLRTWLLTHTHAGVTTGPGATGVFLGTPPPSVPNCQSRHLVEE